ncbi:MAG: hypothetical protein RBS07_08835 [Lentimicrobium sp.]|nr:hypothetical protein [Lentimicrobium sp.]
MFGIRLIRNNALILFQLLVFAALTLLSVLFFRERLIADSGYYLMRMVNSRLPWSEHGRFILIFSQLLPWIGVSFHLPMKAILLLYSLNHVLFHFLVFYLVVFRYKNTGAGMLIVLLQVAGLVTGFLVPMFELYYAASMLVLFAAILYSGRFNTSHQLLMLFLAFFIMSSHPMGIAMLIVVVGYNLIENGFNHRQFYLYLALLLAGLLLFKYFNASEYESGKTAAILQNLRTGKYDVAYFKGLVNFLWKHYLSIALVSVLVVGLIINRKWYKMCWFYLISILAFMILSLLNTGTFDFSRYNEQVWFPVVFVVCFPLMLGLTNNLGRKGGLLLSIVFIAFVGFRFVLITENALVYTQRTNRMKQVIQSAWQFEGRKFIVDDALLTQDGVPGPNWSYPIESMFLSAERGRAQCVSICTTEDYNYNKVYQQLESTNYLFRRFEVEPLTYLNPRYFIMDTGKYRQIYLRF